MQQGPHGRELGRPEHCHRKQVGTAAARLVNESMHSHRGIVTDS